MIEIPDEDLLLTIGTAGRAQTRVKGSRFIAVAVSAPGRGEAGKIVLGEEKKYHDATHHCWAWRSIAEPEKSFAWDDDGEPAGTAGTPILQAIEGRSLAGVVVVVSRYFGGTKLGTGPLARAYSEAAALALAAAAPRKGMSAARFDLSLDYTHLGPVSHLLDCFPCRVISREFGARVGLNIAVAASRADSLRTAVTELTAGQVLIVRQEPGPVLF